MTPTKTNKLTDLTLKAETHVTDATLEATKVSSGKSEKHLQDLVVFWDVWLRTVRRIEKKKRAGVSKRRYTGTYKRILKLCERRSDPHNVSGEAEDTSAMQATIRSIVAPWVSLESLEYADHKLLRELVDECSQVDRILHPLRIRINRKIINLFVILLALGCLAIFILEYQAIVSFGRSYTAVSYRRFWLSVSKMNTEHWLSAMTVLVVVFGAWMTKDMRRF